MATPQNGTAPISADLLNAVTGLNGGMPDSLNEQVQRAKVGFGSDGFFRDVDAANGLPVVGTFFQTTQPVSFTQLGLTDTQLRATAVAVSGTFFQATQPISAASLPLPANASQDGTDGTTPPAVLGGGTGIRGWLRSIYEKLTGTIAVTGTFFQATQPVSATALPLPTGASTETTLAALNTKVTAVNTGAVTISAALPAGANTIGAISNTAFTANAGTNLNTSALSLDATLTNHTQRFQSATTLTTTAAANTAVTLTLPAVAGQFHYITRIEIVRVATAALAGTAVLVYTSTNIPTGWARSAGNAMAAGGTVKDVDEVLENPIKSTTVNTATTIVAPAAGAAVIVRITAYYYTAA